MKRILGVDIGGVIFDTLEYLKKEEKVDEDFLSTPAVKDSIESLTQLNNTIFKDSVYLVSKYHKKRGPLRMQEWLKGQRFYERTGISIEHLYQCEERHQKAPIVKKLGITHFIDDRAEVMSHFAEFVPNLYHFQSPFEDRGEWAINIPNLKFIDNWGELLVELQK